MAINVTYFTGALHHRAVKSFLYGFFSFMHKIAGDACYDRTDDKKVKRSVQVIRKKSDQPDQQTTGSNRVDQVFH
jgi:hypothetical protein